MNKRKFKRGVKFTGIVFDTTGEQYVFKNGVATVPGFLMGPNAHKETFRAKPVKITYVQFKELQNEQKNA
jgi:hypothetical protein